MQVKMILHKLSEGSVAGLFSIILISLSINACSVCPYPLNDDQSELSASSKVEEQSGTPDNAKINSSEYHRAMLGPGMATKAATTGFKLTRMAALYYIPNRLLDFIDIFRADVGVGVSYGGVLRFSRYGQMGYRHFLPYSVRIGIRGLKAPAFIERYTEYGFGPSFRNSRDRPVTVAEFGLGLDLVFVGAYAGLSLDELLDFLGGIIFLDLKGDDLGGKRRGRI